MEMGELYLLRSERELEVKEWIYIAENTKKMKMTALGKRPVEKGWNYFLRKKELSMQDLSHLTKVGLTTIMSSEQARKIATQKELSKYSVEFIRKHRK